MNEREKSHCIRYLRAEIRGYIHAYIHTYIHERKFSGQTVRRGSLRLAPISDMTSEKP